jgi:ribosomal protein L17
MGWAALAGGIAGFMNTWGTAYVNKAAGDAQGMIDDANTYSQNTINRANADAANQIRKANNGFAAAQASLSNLTRSLRNNAKLDTAASQADAITTNIVRLTDAAAQGSLDSQLRAAEQLGAIRAAAASAGVGGTTASMLQKTMQLTSARAQTQADQRTAYQTYDMLAQRAGLLRSAVASLDEGQTFAPIDYNTNIAPLVQSPLRASQFGMSVMAQAWLGAANGAMGQLNLASNAKPGSDVSTNTVGNTQNYSSGAISFGPNTFQYPTVTANDYGVGSNTYGFSTNLGGDTNGFFSTGSSSSIADFQLK